MIDYYTAEKVSTVTGILLYILWVIIGMTMEQTWMIYFAMTGPLLAGLFCTIILFTLRDCSKEE